MVVLFIVRANKDGGIVKKICPYLFTSRYYMSLLCYYMSFYTKFSGANAFSNNFLLFKLKHLSAKNHLNKNTDYRVV